MDCGLDLQTPAVASFNDVLSYFGLAKSEEGTPSTVDLDQEVASPDAAILAMSRKLTYDICLPVGYSPALTGNGTPNKVVQHSPNRVVQHSRCTPQNCRMTSGMCVDCAHCLNHCVCGDTDSKNRPVDCDSKTESSASIGNNNQPLFANGAGNSRYISTDQSKQQQHPPESLRKSPSLVSNSSDGSACHEIAGSNKKKISKTSSHGKKSIKGKKQNGRRFNMGEDEGECLQLTHRMLKEHTNRSRRNSSDTDSHHSYFSYSSSKTGSSSRRRYNFGDEDDKIDVNKNQRRNGGHRRTASGDTTSSRKSNTSFSLLRGRKKNIQQPKKSNHEGTDLIIGKTFSFDSDNTYNSGIISDRTRASASTEKRANSNGGSSLSGSSRSYLDGNDVEAEEPKKSWFRRRYESRE